MAKEIWRAVVGYEGLYEVSSKGRVRSLDRAYICKGHGKAAVRRFKPRILVPGFRGAYLKVTLCRSGKYICHSIHVLVLEAFIGKRPPGKVARHRDGTRLNNSANNLHWGTHAENQADRIEHGTAPIGEKNPSAKLTVAQVLELRAFAQSGVSFTQLGKFYAISRTHARRIVDGRVWGHV